jgi:hypothetical protein
VVIAPYVDDSVGDSGEGAHIAIGIVAPHFRPGCCIEGIDVMITASNVNDSVGRGGGGQNAFGHMVQIQYAV